MKYYDFLICGAGCAGLSMALQLAQALPPSTSILLVDKVRKTANDRSWAFWSDRALPLGLDTIVHKRWSQLKFVAPTWDRTDALGAYAYQFIRGDDYYHHMWAALEQYPNVTFVEANVTTVGQDAEGPFCCLGQAQYRGQWLFDSRLPQWSVRSARQQGGYGLWQHFGGWRIRLDQPAFDPNTANLMDFSVSQPVHGTAFVYLLPFSDTEALVEYTVFSESVCVNSNYDQVLLDYLGQYPAYQIISREYGRIPMTNTLPQDSAGSRIVNVGTRGGAVKPTTGYAFLRTHAQVAAWVNHLALDGVRPTTISDRFAWYDNLLLYLLSNHPERSTAIFSALFQGQPFERILRFLKEDTRWYEDLFIFKDLPLSDFLYAAWMHHSHKGATASVPNYQQA